MARGTHIMLKKMPIMLMLSAPDFAYYAQSFSLLYNYATSYSHIQSRSRKNNNFIQCNINLGTVT